MNTQEYLRLDYLKQRGGELTIGDEYLFYTKHYIVGGKLLRELSAQSEYDTDRLITHFEFRDNKGKPNLPNDFPIKVVYDDGDYECSNIKDFRFSHNDDRLCNIALWKPDYETLLEQQEEYDTIESLKETYNFDLSEPIKDLWALADEIEKSMDEEEKQMEKLTSKDIEWEVGMICAVANKDTNFIYAQYADQYTDGFMKDGEEAFVLGNNNYAKIHFYIVEREQEVPDTALIYTVAMKEKGELPKSGMKCLAEGVECSYIGASIKGEGNAVVEALEDYEMFLTKLEGIQPIKTLSELKAEREEELKDKVAEVLSAKSGDWLSKEYFKKHAQDLFDQGLLRDQSED